MDQQTTGCERLAVIPLGFRGRCIPLVGYEPRPVPGKPGMVMLRDGSTIAWPPPDTQPASSTPSCNPQWNGNVPPNCDATGPFRRVYSGPGLYLAEAYVKLPTKAGQNLPSGDTGYIYTEGWPGAGSNNSEVGLFYQVKSNNFAVYYSVPGNSKPTGRTFPDGSLMGIDIWFQGNTAASCSTTTIHAEPPCIAVLVGAYGTPRAYYNFLHDAHWNFQCCIFARMTTIAQPPGQQNFSDGAEFKGIKWSDGFLAKCTTVRSSSCRGGSGFPWSGGGFQCWPSDKTKIIVTGLDGEVGETDTIYLHSGSGGPKCSG
jgi:hypothetical protein